jgi:hypothetical protein
MSRYYQMQINEIVNEKLGILAEGDALKQLLAEFKVASEAAERKIKELEIQKSIAQEELTTQKIYYQGRIKRICSDYIEHV